MRATRAVDRARRERRHVRAEDDRERRRRLKALQADALDFAADAANYAISLDVGGLAFAWRAHAALLKGATLVVLGLYVLGAALWVVWHGGVPELHVMGGVGVAVLVANATVC